MTSKIKILIADDHTIVRAGLKLLLNNHPQLEVIGEAIDGKDSLQKVIELSPDLLLTDISMPKTNGTETIGEIKKRKPEIKVVILTMHQGEHYVHTALKAGADGYVLKDDTHQELITAITNVFNGKMHLSSTISSSVICGYLSTDSNGATTEGYNDNLTQREREIIKLIAEGYQNKSIAEYLSISIKTVEKHRANLMRKLNLHNTSGVTSYAIKNGLSL